LSTIEQAAKRLEQLKRSGVEVHVPANEEVGAAAVAPKRDPVPLRVARQIDAGEAAADAAGTAGSALHPGAVEPPTATDETPSGIRVDVDLARLSENGYMTPDAPRARIAEEFRVVKRPLMNNVSGKSAAPVRNANRIMVTSSLPGEGKTFVSINLAMSLATEVDTHILLVDADVLRPALLQRMGIPPSRGLLDLLVDPTLSLDEVVLSTNVGRLSILPAGTAQAHATELLASEGMTRLVEKLASADPRRVVVFDTPPLLVTSESRVLASHMGQVILVIGANDTPQATVAEGLAAVENCPVVFTLLNRVSPSERGSYYYGSYGK
jgi:receptor protein-tyrosine kinase